MGSEPMYLKYRTWLFARIYTFALSPLQPSCTPFPTSRLTRHPFPIIQIFFFGPKTATRWFACKPLMQHHRGIDLIGNVL